MKKALKKVMGSVACIACLSSICAISASAYTKASYERPYVLYTYSASAAPDLTSQTTDVTLPANGTTGTDFYCKQFSGSSYAQMTLVNSNLTNNNQAYLHYAGDSSRIVFKPNWILNNNNSRIVRFTAIMRDADLYKNAYIASVAW